jgi:hypothetical protein
MKVAKSLTLLFFAAALLSPIDADAQIGKNLRKRILDRAKDRTEEKMEDKASELIDGQVDKVVDAAFAKTEEKINEMIKASFSKNQANVDLENNVIKQDGQDDIALTPNDKSPTDAEYLQYLQVTVVNLPGGLSEYLGNGSYERIYMHGDLRMARSVSSGSLTDLSKEHMAFLDYEDGTYWVQPFAEFGTMLDGLSGAMQGNPAGQSPQAGQAGEAPNAKVDFKVDVRKGGSGMKRGVEAEQQIVIIETKIEAEDEDSGETYKGTLYTVTDTWTTGGIAGLKTIQEYGVRMAKIIGDAFKRSATGQSLQVNMLGDPRMSAAMEEAGKKLSEIEGFPVQTETFMVQVPEGKTLDLDKVLAGGETDLADWSNSMSNESDGPQEQVTMFSSLTFVSNMRAEQFDVDLLSIPADLKEVDSPMVMLKEKMQEDN